MGVFRQPPPTFIGGPQPYEPKRKVLPPTGVGPSFVVRSTAILSVVIAAWQPEPDYPQQSRHVLAPAGVSAPEFVQANRPRLSTVLGSWGPTLDNPQARRYALAVDLYEPQPFTRPWLSTVLGSWEAPPPDNPQVRRYAPAVDQYEPQPFTRAWQSNVLDSWQLPPDIQQVRRYAVAVEQYEQQPATRSWLPNVINSWEPPPPDFQQPKRYAVAVEQYEPQPATRSWLPAVIASWPPLPDNPQARRYAVAAEQVEIQPPPPFTRSWLPHVLESWQLPLDPQGQAKRYAVAVDQYEPQPFKQAWLSIVLISWEEGEGRRSGQVKVTPAAGEPPPSGIDAAPSTRPWLSAVLDGWSPFLFTPGDSKGDTILELHDASPVLRPWLANVLSSWVRDDRLLPGQRKATPPEGVPPVVLPIVSSSSCSVVPWVQEEFQLQPQRARAFTSLPGSKKALLIWAQDSVLINTENIALFGGGSTLTELDTRFQATEACTLSGLAWNFTGGGSLTNNLRLRKNGANGNQLATRSGPGFSEDAVNVDVLAAGDTFNCQETDTGTDPTTVIYARANVEFASGHGNFHAGAKGATVGIGSVASTTRYIALSGELTEGLNSDIADAQWKNRAYTSVAAIQVRVTDNARTTATTFGLNINGSNVGTAITVGAGAIGLFTATLSSQLIDDGDLVCLRATTLSGTEELRISFAGATLKSNSNKSEAWAHSQGSGHVRAASGTASYRVPGGDFFSFGATEANTRVKIGFPARITNLRTYVRANTYTGACTLKAFVNGTAVLTKSITAAATGWQENAIDTFQITDTDEVSVELLGGTSGSATFAGAGFTLEQAPSSGVIPLRSASEWLGVEHQYQKLQKVLPPAGGAPPAPPADFFPSRKSWLDGVISSWGPLDAEPQGRVRATPPEGVPPPPGPDSPPFQPYPIVAITDHWYKPAELAKQRHKLFVEPIPFVPGPDSPPFPPYPIVAISDHWYTEPVAQHFPTLIIPPEGVPPPVIPPGPEPEPLVTGSGGKRKLPKKRRATIRAHIERLKNPENLTREMEIALKNLQALDALDQLLTAQDQLLLDRYRDIYLEYLLKQDDEAIIMLAG